MKTFKCPYCDNKYIRPKLVNHINRVHREMIPEGYDAQRLVFDIVNNTTGGKCRVCGSPTEWNPSLCKYNVLCSNPKCKETMRENYKRNMLRVRGTFNILDNPEQQKIMLANRRISGKYKHSDGGIITYTGSYERAALEFLDVYMQFPSVDIMAPGPTIEYMYKGQKHIYLPDFYIISLNMIIEIKDGGNNINNKNTPGMIASREKTIEKERIITDRGEYNYIRLTNNQFDQFIDIIIAIKEKNMNDDGSPTVRIHEGVVPISRSPLPADIIRLNLKLNQYEYIIPNNGDIVYKISAKDYWYKYRYLTVEEFEQYGGGICWDYVRYEHRVFPVAHKCYYVMFNCENEPTHTFLIFPYKDKYYWFESSWKRSRGIYEFNSLNEAIFGVCKILYEDELHTTGNRAKYFYLSEYNPDEVPDGCTCEEFMKWQGKRCKRYNTSILDNANYYENKYIDNTPLPISG